MSRNKKPISRRDDLVVQELNGEVLVYDLKTHKALCLNETSALVWNACDGTRDLGELREYASTKMKASVTDDLIWLAIDQLSKEKLIENAPQPAAHLTGLSRRDVVKRIGVGAMVAIPIVSGLMAPRALAAGSTCGTVCTCDNSNATAGTVCSTGAAGGVACPGGTPCTRCQANATGKNVAGTCIV